MKNNILNKISYHAVYDDSIIDALKYAKANGFTGVQVGIESPHLSFEDLSDKQSKEIKDYAVKNDLRLVLHAPDDSLSLFEYSKYLQQGIFNYYQALFSFAKEIEVQMITIHIGSMVSFRTDSEPEQKIPKADLSIYEKTFNENVGRLIEMVNRQFILCVENYNLDKNILELLQPYLDRNQIYLCWDIAKTFDKQMRKNKQLEDYFWKNIKHIRQVHLHDRNLRGLSHRVIGSGKINFNYFLSQLKSVDILDYCIEVRPQEKAKESLKNLRKLLKLI